MPVCSSVFAVSGQSMGCLGVEEVPFILTHNEEFAYEKYFEITSELPEYLTWIRIEGCTACPCGTVIQREQV
jgi:hypothetical protein